MTSPPEDVYEAAARAYDRAVNDTLRNPPGYVLGDSARARLVEMAHFRAAVDLAFAAGVAAGRTQAAADIRAADRGLTCSTACLGERCDCAAIEVIEEAAKIAGGEPRG